MTTLRVIIEEVLSPVPNGISRYSNDLTRALVATAPLLLGLGPSLAHRDSYLYNAFDTRFDNLAVGCLLAVCASRPAHSSSAYIPPVCGPL